jgi:hypothetical protein
VTAVPGVGPQYPQPDPRGWLVFEHLPDELQRAEDATQNADYGRADGLVAGVRLQWDREARVWYFERPATDAERTLLQHLGYTLPSTLTTRVDYATETLRCRTWPQLETQELSA